jgi:hypothetical protein
VPSIAIAIPVGVLNEAAMPVASVDPGLPEPAKVDTRPALVILRIV